MTKIVTVKVLKFHGATGLRKAGSTYRIPEPEAAGLVAKGFVEIVKEKQLKEDKTGFETKEMKPKRKTA